MTRRELYRPASALLFDTPTRQLSRSCSLAPVGAVCCQWLVVVVELEWSFVVVVVVVWYVVHGRCGRLGNVLTLLCPSSVHLVGIHLEALVDLFPSKTSMAGSDGHGPSACDDGRFKMWLARFMSIRSLDSCLLTRTRFTVCQCVPSALIDCVRQNRRTFVAFLAYEKILLLQCFNQGKQFQRLKETQEC